MAIGKILILGSLAVVVLFAGMAVALITPAGHDTADDWFGNDHHHDGEECDEHHHFYEFREDRHHGHHHDDDDHCHDDDEGDNRTE